MPLPAQRVQEQSGGLLAGEILLPADEIAVANGKAAPDARVYVVGTDLLQLVLDAPRHDVLVFGQKIHGPDSAIGEILLDVGEAGDRLVLHEILAIGELRE